METESGAEYISPTHVRHIMRYVKAMDLLSDKPYLVLDAACGTGYGSQMLSRFHKVIGIDASEDAIKEAKKLENENCKFFKSNLLDQSFRQAGAIVSIETIEHFTLDAGKQVLANFKTWLPRLGKLIITTPYCIQSGPSPITKQHLHEFSLTDLEITLNDAGFSVQAIYPERHEGQAGRLGYCMVHAISR